MKNGTKNRKSYVNGEIPTRAELLAAHRRALKRLGEMTPEQGFDLLVKTGIYTRNGKLTRRYGGRAKDQTSV